MAGPTKFIVRVNFEASSLMKTEGLTDGFKTLVLQSDNTVYEIKLKLAEKLVKGMLPGAGAQITTQICAMSVALHSPKRSKTEGGPPALPGDDNDPSCLYIQSHLDDAETLLKLGLGKHSDKSQFFLTHPEHIYDPLSYLSGGADSHLGFGNIKESAAPPTTTNLSSSPASSTPTSTPAPPPPTAGQSERSPVEKKARRHLVGSGKATKDRASHHPGASSSSSSSSPSSSAATLDNPMYTTQIAQLVSVCDILFQELVETKRANVELRARLDQLEAAASPKTASTALTHDSARNSTPPSSSSSSSSSSANDGVVNVKLRRMLASLRRETQPEEVVDEEAVIKDFDERGGGIELLFPLILAEIDESDSEATLFRGRSAATILVSRWLNREGDAWTKDVLTPLLNRLARVDEGSTPCCEVNPAKMGTAPSKDILRNRDNLREMFVLVVSDVFRCVLPPRFIELFHFVREQATTRFDKDMGLRAVAGFFFLRFFCPKLLSFSCNPESRRTFLYVSKILQNLANNQPFDKKEIHMMDFNPLITVFSADMSGFLTRISEPVTSTDVPAAPAPAAPAPAPAAPADQPPLSEDEKTATPIGFSRRPFNGHRLNLQDR